MELDDIEFIESNRATADAEGLDSAYEFDQQHFLQGRAHPLKYTPYYYEFLVSRAFDKFTRRSEEMLQGMVQQVSESEAKVASIISRTREIQADNTRMQEYLDFLSQNNSRQRITNFQGAVQQIRSRVKVAREQLSRGQEQFLQDKATNQQLKQEIEQIDAQIISIIDQLSHFYHG